MARFKAERSRRPRSVLERQIETDRKARLFAILRLPRSEGDQEVTTLGSIQIDATKGADSAPFSFWVPLTRQTMKQRVLVVEDEEKLRRVIELQLRSAGFEVDQAGSAEEASSIQRTARILSSRT